MTPPRKSYPGVVPASSKAKKKYYERLELLRKVDEYNAARKAELANSPERIALRIKQITRTYKLAESELHRMLSEQGRSCAICRAPFDGHEYCVDHNHITGEVRGLLCHTCNVRIGGWDDTAFARSAAAYLKIIPREKSPLELDLERQRSVRDGSA